MILLCVKCTYKPAMKYMYCIFQNVPFFAETPKSIIAQSV
jgi:hypothetical protein